MGNIKRTVSATAVIAIAFAATTVFADPDFGAFAHKAYIDRLPWMESAVDLAGCFEASARAQTLVLLR
jgi:hypothetical protein